MKPVKTPTILILCAMMVLFMPLALAKKGGNVDWKQLNLSPAQSQNINKIESEWERTYRQLSPQIERDKQALMQELGSPNPDRQKVMQLQTRIEQNKMKLKNASMDVYLEKSEQLDSGQKKQLKQMMFEN